MRILVPIVLLAVASAPAAGQTHAQHTAAHDSAHAIMLSDADHLALHQFLLGQWAGMAHGAGHDTVTLRFENDSSHQQLLVRQHGVVSGFEIRGDTLRWKQDVSGSVCVASTPVSTLLQAARSTTGQAALISGTMTCGKIQAPFTLRKAGS